MASFDLPGPARRGSRRSLPIGPIAGLVLAGLLLLTGLITYNSFKIDIGQGRQAVLIRKVGLDLGPQMEIAPPYDSKQGFTKGVQPGVLKEGRYFYNPFYWDWELSDQYLVPEGQCAVAISLVGDDLPEGQILAAEGQKGIRPGVIESGARVAYNPYELAFENVPSIEVPPGCRGVVTLLAGKEPVDPNLPIVAKGERGVQEETLPPGRYFLNPYEYRVHVVDCRTQRFELSDNPTSDQDSYINFLSSDGFEISLNGIVAYRVMEDRAAEIYVLYNEDANGDSVSDEIVNKIITPESRSICRISGSKLTAVQFITGEERTIFQENLEKTLKDNCAKQGIEVLSVSITGTKPPEEIAAPLRARDVAKQKLVQYQQEKLKQESEAQLKVRTLEADQKARLVDAEKQVIQQVTKAQQEQGVAKLQADQRLAVAATQLEAAEFQAQSIRAEAEAEANVIRFKNKAELAGLATRVEAFGGDGAAVAQNILVGKLAPAYRSILSSTEGPLMEMFSQFSKPTTNRPLPLGPTASLPPRAAPSAGPEAAEVKPPSSTNAPDAETKPDADEARLPAPVFRRDAEETR